MVVYSYGFLFLWFFSTFIVHYFYFVKKSFLPFSSSAYTTTKYKYIFKIVVVYLSTFVENFFEISIFNGLRKGGMWKSGFLMWIKGGGYVETKIFC